MKKGWKIFWIICISLAVLGIVFCISGAVLGATWSGVRTVLEGVGLYHEDDEWDDWDDLDDGRHTDISKEDGQSTAVESSSQSMDFAGIRELDIDVVCPKVVIEEYEGSDIHVETRDIPEDIQNNIRIYSEHEELKIELKNKKHWMNRFGNLNGILTVQIPRDYVLEKASVEVDAGDLKVENICAGELDIQIGAGRAVVNQFSADTFDLECGAGEAQIAGEARREIQMECGVGKVLYKAAGRQEDYNYELDCGIGDLKVGNDSFSGLNSERKINNNGQIKMKIECGIGTVEVTFSEEM